MDSLSRLCVSPPPSLHRATGSAGAIFKHNEEMETGRPANRDGRPDVVQTVHVESHRSPPLLRRERYNSSATDKNLTNSVDNSRRAFSLAAAGNTCGSVEKKYNVPTSSSSSCFFSNG